MAIFTNRATMTYNNVTVNSNTAQGVVLEPLAIQKTAVRKTYGAESVITYLVTLTNSSANEITGLSVRDSLGEYDWNQTKLVPMDYIPDSVIYLKGDVLQPAPTVTAGPPMLISGISVPANGSVVLSYQVKLNDFAPLDVGETIVNTAEVLGTSTELKDTETITVANAANLTITKSISPVPVAENGRVTYTFLIQNTGNAGADAAAEIQIIDNFVPPLSDLTVDFNGTSWTGDATKYSYTNNRFTTVAGAITVPAATYDVDTQTGRWVITPGVRTLTITGII